MRAHHLIALVVFLAATPLVASSQSSSFMPKFTAIEGKLKNVKGPDWQLLVTIRIADESDINPRFNQLLGALVTFVDKHGKSSRGVMLSIYADEKYAETINKAMGVVLEEAASRSTPAVIDRLQISVTITDPETKNEKAFEFKKS